MKPNSTVIRIGAGAGFAGDRLEPALELAEHGQIDYLIFECLAERTIALAQLARLGDSAQGFDPLLEDRLSAVLPVCRRQGIKIITNMGAANPAGAAAKVVQLAQRMGLRGLNVAAVTGDDVLSTIQSGDYRISETGATVASLGSNLISANAYLGGAPLVAALAEGADIVVTGRVADPSLFLAPLVHEFGWSLDDWRTLGQGTVIGHLLECAGQVTGGYFSDPGVKDCAGLARLGFPIAEVSRDGSAVITKVAGSGGAVTARTCKEQLLYEIHDPAHYLTPDVTGDFTAVSLTEIAPDRVAVAGGNGCAAPEMLKVSLGYRAGFVGEGQISYAGFNALSRARLALEIVRERLRLIGIDAADSRFELIGVDSILPDGGTRRESNVAEVRARMVVRTTTLRDATRIGHEVESLYTNGPAGGGGVTKGAKEVIAILSTVIPRRLVKPNVTWVVT